MSQRQGRKFNLSPQERSRIVRIGYNLQGSNPQNPNKVTYAAIKRKCNELGFNYDRRSIKLWWDRREEFERNGTLK